MCHIPVYRYIMHACNYFLTYLSCRINVINGYYIILQCSSFAFIQMFLVAVGVDSNVIVFIHSSPAGTLVTDQPHTFDYPILSSVTLTCLVIYSNGTPVATSLVSNYRWNTTKCYRNNAHHGGTPRCFPHSQTIQTITADYLTAVDAGTISCSATVGSVIRTTYTSSPLTLRISGNIFSH